MSRVAIAILVGASVAIVACSDDDGSGGQTSSGGGAGEFILPASGGSTGGSMSSGGSSGNMSSGGTTPATGGASTGGGPSTGGPAGACLLLFSRCDDNAAGCCDGTVCAQNDQGNLVCRAICEQATDCGTLCCLLDETVGQKLCKPTSECPAPACSNEGGACDGFTTCCRDLICVASSDPMQNGCRPRCTTADDCTSDCCILFTGGQLGFCTDASQCMCAGADETCGGTKECCDGFTCTTFDQSGAFACKPTCTVDADCTTNCCVPVGSTGVSACQASTRCN